MAFFQKTWDFLFSMLLAFIISMTLEYDMWSDICSELITFFGIQAAVVLPTIIFASGILGPIGKNVKKLREYNKALYKQSVFWVSLLALDFLSVLLLIVGKSTDWPTETYIDIKYFTLNFSTFANFFTALIVILACVRMISMINGILSLQKFNADIIEEVMVSEIKKPSENKEIDYETPESFGAVKKQKKT